MSEQKEKTFTQYHKDGSIWAKGKVIGTTPVGDWVWFRRDGTKLRSGSYRDGIQVGEWTTYDQMGAVYKVTDMKAGKKAAKKAAVEQAHAE